MSAAPVSIDPAGGVWRIPSAAELDSHWNELEKSASGKKVVVVQGLGFVGAAVATALATAKDSTGQPLYFVIGVDLATPAAWWKIATLAAGRSPFTQPDPEFAGLLERAVSIDKNLVATASEHAYRLADVIVVDVQLDVVAGSDGLDGDIRVATKEYESALRSVGRGMKPDTLVVIETTVPIGMTEKFARPILEEERRSRGITSPLRLAHAYERVMPGRRYLDSIRKFWRVFAAEDELSRRQAGEFLASFVQTSNFPPTCLADTTASEMAKLLENSYRAANIAFIHEWTLLAERTGVNLWDVVDAIRLRKGTHDNMRYPGFGVGGYCLTKDSYLAAWGARELLGVESHLPVTLAALATNRSMPLHTLDLLRDCAGGDLSGLRILLCGVSYLADVADTRNSPSRIFAEAARAEGADVRYHDPLVDDWPEQSGVERVSDWRSNLGSHDAVVFAVPHGDYRNALPSDFPSGFVVVDAANVLDDAAAAELRAKGCLLAGAGKGHWRRMGWHTPS